MKHWTTGSVNLYSGGTVR